MIKTTKSALKFFVILLILFRAVNSLVAQNDTIWYDAKWKPTTKEKASFYRPPVQKKGNLYHIKDYYINHTLQMEGTSPYADKDEWEGLAIWYDKTGKLSQSITYKDGQIEGELITYFRDQKLIAQFKNGSFISGKMNFSLGEDFRYSEKIDGIIKEVVYHNDLDGIRYEGFRKLQDGYLETIETKYYGANGEFLGTYVLDYETGKSKGIEVDYYHDPLRVRNIRDYNYHKNGFITITYYPNGKVRRRFIRTPTPKLVYYDREENLIASLNIDVENDSWKLLDGKNVVFYSNDDPKKMHLIRSVEEFDKEGNVIALKEFYENQEIHTKTSYINKEKSEVIKYDTTGKEIARLTYKDFGPYQGTLINKNTSQIFEQGKIIKETDFYPETNIPFRVYENQKVTFYDVKGAKISEVTSASDNYFAPKEGTVYAIDEKGRRSGIKIYKDETKIYDKEYLYLSDDFSNVEIEEVFYDHEGNREKKVSYYHNTPKKRSVLFYKNSDKLKEVFFDRKGDTIAVYNHKEKHGAHFKYFNKTDTINIFKKMDHGKLVQKKEYKQEYKRNFKGYDYVLVEDSNVESKAVFYKVTGEVIAELIFKNKKPYQGTLYDHNRNTFYTIKDGKRNGSYQKIAYDETTLEKGNYLNDLKDGQFVNYNRNGKITLIENYKEDKLDGETKYFDEKGTLLSTLVYKNGLPYKGKEINRDREIWYEGGKVVKESENSKGQIIVKEYISESLQEVVVYYPNMKNKKYTYTLKNNNIDGEVIRYDQEGSVQQRAKFIKGTLKSGTILIKESLYLISSEQKIWIKKESDTLFLEIYNEKEEIILEVKEKSNEYGEFSKTKRLGFDINNIRQDFLF